MGSMVTLHDQITTCAWPAGRKSCDSTVGCASTLRLLTLRLLLICHSEASVLSASWRSSNCSSMHARSKIAGPHWFKTQPDLVLLQPG